MGHSVDWEIFVAETPFQTAGCSFLWSSSKGVFSFLRCHSINREVVLRTNDSISGDWELLLMAFQ